jgi:predicted nucleic acid-binding protein
LPICAATIQPTRRPYEPALHPRYRPRIALSASPPSGGRPRPGYRSRRPGSDNHHALGEQVQGRLAVIRQARSQPDAARGYLRLRETVEFYQTIQLIDYTTAAIARFEELRRQGIRIGTQDLRIAAIALAEGSILVSRNTRDFAHVLGLTLED